jgi:hypothetical protein
MPQQKNQLSEADNFDAGVRKILSVSHDEVKRREEQWKREREGKAKPGPKPKQHIIPGKSLQD